MRWKGKKRKKRRWRADGNVGRLLVVPGWYPVAVACATFLLLPPNSSCPTTPYLTTLHLPFPSLLRTHVHPLHHRLLLLRLQNGAAPPRLLRPGQRHRLHAGPRRRRAARGAGPRRAVLLAGLRHVAGGGRRGGAPLRGVRRGGGGSWVPRGLLGLPWVEGSLRLQRVDRAAEGLRGGAAARHAVHAAGRRARPRALHRHGAGRARPGRPGRPQIPLAHYAGEIPDAEPQHAASLVRRHAAHEGGRRRRGRAGGAVRERPGHGLRPRREQGQGPAQRPCRAPPPEAGCRARRLRQEDRVGLRAVPALGRLPAGQVRPRPLRAEQGAAGARRAALRTARYRVILIRSCTQPWQSCLQCASRALLVNLLFMFV